MGKTETVICCGRDGRINIPKRLRETIGITGSEPLVLKADGKSLILEKYQELETLEGVCNLYLRAFAKNCHSPVAVCDTEHILASRGIPLPAAPLLSGKLRERIHSARPYQPDREASLDLFGDGKYRVDTMCPIHGRNGPAGAVLLLHHRDVPQTEQLCAGLLADILSECIKKQ